jgi:hypothetical protein
MLNQDQDAGEGAGGDAAGDVVDAGSADSDGPTEAAVDAAGRDGGDAGVDATDAGGGG